MVRKCVVLLAAKDGLLVNASIARLFRWIVVLFSLPSLMTSSAQKPSSQNDDVVNIAQSGDRRILAVTYFGLSNAGRVDFFDAESGEFVQTADLSPYAAHQMALSPNGDCLLWTDAGGALGIYERMTDNNMILAPPNHMAALGSIAWSPSTDVFGYSLGVGLSFGSADVVGESVGDIHAGSVMIGSFAFSPDGQRIATSQFSRDAFDPNSYTALIQIWDNLYNRDEIIRVPSLRIDGHGGGAIAWSPDGQRIAVNELGGFVVYNLDANTLLSFPYEDSTTALAWSPDGTRLALGGSSIRIWDTTTWRVIQEIPDAAPLLRWSPDGHFLYSDSGENGLARHSVASVDG